MSDLSPDDEGSDDHHKAGDLERETSPSRHDKAGKRRAHHNDDKHMRAGMYLKREIHFTVESPDGEQMPVRYKGEMTVESLFIQACKKFHLNHHDHYMVINNREMEMSDLMKKFNINQNSVVRVYKGNKKSASPDIFVSVRIRDCRIGSVFRQTDNLWDIVTKLLSSSSIEKGMVPIVIYLKTELIGEPVLRQVRLRDMGISQGSVIVRFLQLKQEDLDQRKMKEDEDTMATLESLELKAAGPTADAGLRNVHFRLSEDEIDSENIQFIGERKALAFRLPPAENPEEKVQQDYFDLLVEEIQSLFAEKCKQKPAASKGDVIDVVKAELKKLKEIRSDYDDCIVRVQFPDKMVLQFLMLPEERVADIKDFMKKFLRDPNCDFDLTLPHTKEIVPDQMTLIDLKMIPVARFFYAPREMRFESVEQYLADEYVISCVPYSDGKEAALMLRGESLENFLLADSERDSMMRKSTGGFLSKFQRTSHSSGRASSTREPGGSRSKSVWVKKQSSFQPRSWSRGSSGRGSDDDDDDEVSIPSSTKKIGGERSIAGGLKMTSLSQAETSRPGSLVSDGRKSTNSDGTPAGSFSKRKSSERRSGTTPTPAPWKLFEQEGSPDPFSRGKSPRKSDDEEGSPSSTSVNKRKSPEKGTERKHSEDEGNRK